MGAGNPRLPERIPTPGTRGHGKSPTQVTPTGLSPSTAPDFHRSSASPGRGYPGPVHPTSPRPFGRGFGLGCAAFGRPYSRHRVLLSFPAGTKMLQFPAFPCLVGTIRRSPVRWLRAPRRGLSQLATAFFGARAEPSTGRVGSAPTVRLAPCAWRHPAVCPSPASVSSRGAST
ncbi:MAG: hypothetical protein PWQ11_554 [Candidatus Diapherotrites archaeon]|nr:hypothetical protein [Candidatus Diapherotrites archaeon]